MSSPDQSDDRVERERAFHDGRYTNDPRERTHKYYAAAGSGKGRYLSLVDAAPGARVLEYGCGPESAALGLAAAGARVTAIDISPVAIRRGQRAAEERGVSIEFREMNAEHLDFDDASFDLVCGSGILHHLDLDAAFAEIARVLAPGGRAVFFEPMGHNPVINLYRRLTPKMRTVDEHPLRMDDFARARARFGHVETEFYELCSLAAAPLTRVPGGRTLARTLQRFDRWLFRTIPPLRRLAWTVVIVLEECFYST